MTALLEVDHLAVQLPIERRHRPVLHDVSFRLERGEVLAVVGESGSGKSMTARAVLQLLPAGATTSGRIVFDGLEVAKARKAELRELRSRRIGMIFQDPRAAINPVHRIGDFLTEVLVREHGVAKRLLWTGRRRCSTRSGSTSRAAGCASIRTSCRAECCSA